MFKVVFLNNLKKVITLKPKLSRIPYTDKFIFSVPFAIHWLFFAELMHVNSYLVPNMCRCVMHILCQTCRRFLFLELDVVYLATGRHWKLSSTVLFYLQAQYIAHTIMPFLARSKVILLNSVPKFMKRKNLK